MKVKTDNLLTLKELHRELLKRDIDIAYNTLFHYIYRGDIPDEYIIVKKKGKKRFYYFLPEAVDYLVDMLLDEDFRD